MFQGAMSRLIGVLVACLFLSACRGSITIPRHIDALLSGTVPAATGTAAVSENGDKVAVSVFLLHSGAVEWNATIRDGTCQNLGPVLFPLGVIDNATLNNVSVDASLDSLRGKLVVVSRLGEDAAATCGPLG